MSATHARPTLLWIQALRAIAALVVVVAHTNAETGWFAYYLSKPSGLPSFVTGAAGVDLFFVISGFVMVYSSEGLFGGIAGARMFLARRLLRIVPLYWLTTFATLLVWRHFGISWEQQSVTWSNVIASLLFYASPRVGANTTDPIVGVGWSLNYEMFFYVCFAIAILARPRLAILGTATALFLYGKYRALLPFDPPLALAYVGNPNLWEFAAGLIIGFVYREGLRIPAIAAAILMVAGVAAIAATAVWDDLSAWLPRFYLWAVPCMLIVLGAVMMPNPSPTSWRWRVAVFLGDASYAIYLTHGLVMMSIRMQWIDSGAALYNFSPLAYATFIAVVSTLVGCVTHVSVERPITRTLKRLLSHPRADHSVASQTAGPEDRPDVDKEAAGDRLAGARGS